MGDGDVFGMSATAQVSGWVEFFNQIEIALPQHTDNSLYLLKMCSNFHFVQVFIPKGTKSKLTDTEIMALIAFLQLKS